MKIFEADNYTHHDYVNARKKGLSVTVRPESVDVEEAASKYIGVPAYIFWELTGGKNIAYAISYEAMDERRDNVIAAFGISEKTRYYSVAPRGYSKTWKVVEDLKGDFVAFSGRKFRDMQAELEKLDPHIVQLNTAVLARLIEFNVPLPSLRHFVVIGGMCYPADPEVMAEAADRYGVPVFTSLTLPWAGPVTKTDGATFKEGYVGPLLPKLEAFVSQDGWFHLRTAMTQDGQYWHGGQWHPMGYKFYRTGVRGFHADDGFYVTERPAVAIPPQPLDG